LFNPLNAAVLPLSARSDVKENPIPNDKCLSTQNRLANVQQLGSAFADNVHAEDF
jgi:hypothetical protein